MLNLVRPISGLPFNDGLHSGVMQLVIRHYGMFLNSWWLHSIDIKYHDGSGISTWSEVHGCQIDCPTTKMTMIKLDYPNEYLTGMCGHLDIPWPQLPWVTAVRSITFISNKKMYGPFGDPIGRFVSDTMPGTMIVGFYGSSLPMSGLLHIGALRQPLDAHQICPPKDLSPAPSCPPKDLIPPGDSLQRKLKKDEDDNTNEHSTCVVSNNQISKNHGDGNGSLSVGNKITKYLQFGIFKGSNP